MGSWHRSSFPSAGRSLPRSSPPKRHGKCACRWVKQQPHSSSPPKLWCCVSRRSWVLALVVLICFSCKAQEHGTLKVAAAADLQPVLPAIIQEFEQQTHERVEASYASSATLATQILNGGPFGLFLSADLSFPQKIVAAGLADSAEPIPYARGTLVLWARNDSPVQPLSIDSLRSPALRTLAVANAEHAPYGRAAKAAIEKLGLAGALKGKL